MAINWIKTFDDVPLNRIKLTAVQAQNDNKNRRNRFYEQFGIEFEYRENKDSGISKPMNTHQLKNTENWMKTIKKYEAEEFIDLIAEIDANLISANSSLEIDRTELKFAREKPIRWAIMALMYKIRMKLAI